VINTDNRHQHLANFAVDTTFLSNNTMKEKMLALVPKKEQGPLPARNSSLSRCNCLFYWGGATSFPGNGDNLRCISIYIKRNGS
jgi:hypothetical protein